MKILGVCFIFFIVAFALWFICLLKKKCPRCKQSKGVLVYVENKVYMRCPECGFVYR